jgi:hypothetical protein
VLIGVLQRNIVAVGIANAALRPSELKFPERFVRLASN